MPRLGFQQLFPLLSTDLTEATLTWLITGSTSGVSTLDGGNNQTKSMQLARQMPRTSRHALLNALRGRSPSNSRLPLPLPLPHRVRLSQDSPSGDAHSETPRASPEPLLAHRTPCSLADPLLAVIACSRFRKPPSGAATGEANHHSCLAHCGCSFGDGTREQGITHS